MRYIFIMSLKVCSIASGSKGNCIYVSSRNTELIIDLGISYTRAERCIKLLGGSGIENILLTHCHSDHFGHVPMALKKGATLYYNKICRADVAGIEGNTVETSGRFEVGDISVLPFSVSHDVPCVGYALKSGNSKVSVITDLGHLPGECMDIISDSGMVVIEANYDEEMLAANRQYPFWLKQRISGTHGHLSNTAASNAVCELARCGVGHIMLAHLSEHNNTRNIALNACAAALDRVRLAGNTRLDVAEQDSMSGLFEVI